MQMGDRAPMDGWIRASRPRSSTTDAVLARWVERGVAHARSLPPKS